LARQLAAIPGVSVVEQPSPERYRMLADRDVRPDAARAVVVAGGQLRRLSVEEPSLDAIYSRFFQGIPSDEARNAA
jgi:ABC-2 type transport system ATP-binding protein